MSRNFGKRSRAAIYTRVSTTTQAEKGGGLEVQLAACHAECQKRNYIVDESRTYVDRGVSGTINARKREAFARLLEDAKKNLFEVLVINSFDRLARDLRIFLSIIDEIASYGIKLIACRENIDTTTDIGDFYLNILASVSNLELRLIKTRMMSGKKYKRNETGYVGGTLPYGYKAIDKKVQIDKEKSKVVKMIFTLYCNKVSMNRIAEILNEKQVPTPKKGKKWYVKSISTIIKNRDKYMGGIMNNNSSGIRWPTILGDGIGAHLLDTEDSKETKDLIDKYGKKPKIVKPKIIIGDDYEDEDDYEFSLPDAGTFKNIANN